MKQKDSTESKKHLKTDVPLLSQKIKIYGYSHSVDHSGIYFSEKHFRKWCPIKNIALRFPFNSLGLVSLDSKNANTKHEVFYEMTFYSIQVFIFIFNYEKQR